MKQVNRMKNNLPNDGHPKPINLNDLLAIIGQQAHADDSSPKFRYESTVYLKIGDLVGMVLAVTAHPNRYTYLVRWGDGTMSECEEFELSNAKEWKG